MQLQVPERYQLAPRALLGEGGMASVFRAWDRILEVPVALKVVRPDLASSKGFQRRFALEVRICARITHPHIVPLHDHGQLTDGTPYLGLAFADAGSFELLMDANLQWHELLPWMLELLEALSHLHARDLLHRDLKPSNVLLHSGPDGHRHVWLADLGLASVASDVIRRRGRTEGTPGYMAPEQALGQPREFGPWTDLYSVGVILWELLTGDLPFGEDNLADAFPLPAFVPRIKVPYGLETVLANLLRPEPFARYDLAADLATELQALGAADRAAGPGVASTRTGTIARSAPAMVPKSGAAQVEDPPHAREGAAATLPWWSDQEELPSSLESAIWNRPLPSVVPERVPCPTGLGATARASLPLFALREPPLVAREGLRQALWDHARAVRDDRAGRVVVLVGEAGSGKTRLVTDLCAGLEAGGWAESLVLTYARDPTDMDGFAGAARRLLRPWNEQRASLEARLRRRLSRERGIADDAVDQDAALLAQWCGLLREGEAPVPFGIGLREVYRHLEARAWRGLCCLVLDDVQWATEDGDGLDIPEALLQRWREDNGAQPMLVVVTARRDELASRPELRKRLLQLESDGAIRLDVPQLDVDATRQVLEEMLTLTPSLADRLAHLCEGNPLFARQLLIDWTERGWLVDGGDLAFDLQPGVDVTSALPRDARALFRLRVADLAHASGDPKAFERALHIAALAGRSRPANLLAELVPDDLAEFARTSGLWSSQPDRLTFDSALLHQALVEDAQRRPDVSQIHADLAHAWAATAHEIGTRALFEAGKHATEAGDPTFALPWLVRACQDAWARGQTHQLEQASAWLLQAVVRGEPTPELDAAANLWRARALQTGGDAPEAEQYFVRARQRFEAHDNPRGVVESLLGVGWASMHRGVLDEAYHQLADALARARQMGDRRLEVRALASHASLEQTRRNFDGANILYEQVLARMDALDDPQGLAQALLGQGTVASRTGDYDEATHLFEQAAAAFQKMGDLNGVGRARTGMATVARMQRRWDLSGSLSKRAIDLFEELGSTVLLVEARLGLADLARFQGNLDRAQRQYARHAADAERHGAFEARIRAALGLGRAALQRRQVSLAEQHLGFAAALLREAPGHWLWATARLAIASLWAVREDPVATRSWLWSASDLGLGDTVDLDDARDLVDIVHIAREAAWEDVLPIATKLALQQLEGLGDIERAQRLRQPMRTPAAR